MSTPPAAVFTPTGPSVDDACAAALRSLLRAQLIDVTQQAPVDGCDHYTGTQATVLGVACDVSVFHRANASVTEVLLLVARRPQTTELQAFFPSLPGSDQAMAPLIDAGVEAPTGFYLAQLPIATPTWVFVYSTLDRAALDPVVSACIPELAGVVAGINPAQAANLALDGAPAPADGSLAKSVVDGLAGLDAAVPLAWRGAVFDRDGLQFVALGAGVLSPDQPLTLGPMLLRSLRVMLEAPEVALLSETVITLDGTVEIGSSGMLQLAATWPVYGEVVSLYANLSGSPASLLPQGVTLPDGLLPSQASIECRVDVTKALEPRYLALRYTVTSWEIFPGLFTLDALDVSIATPLGNATGLLQASFSAASSLGRAELRCAGEFPSGDLYFTLASTDPLTLADLGTALFGGAAARSLMVGPLTSFGLTTLRAEANTVSGAWSVVVGLGGNWQILEPAKHGVGLAIHTLSLAMAKPPQESLMVSFGAQGVIGELAVGVEGSVDTGTGAWSLAAWAQAAGGATLASLGLRGLPDWASGLRLFELGASFNSATGDFSFNSAVIIPIGGEDLSAQLLIARQSAALDIQGSLAWAGLSLSLAAYQDSTRTGFVADWRSQQSVALGDLIARWSSELGSVLPAFTLPITAVSVGAVHVRDTGTWLMGLTIGDGAVEFPANTGPGAIGFVAVVVDPLPVSDLLALLPGAVDGLIDLSAVMLSGLRLEVGNVKAGLFKFQGQITGLETLTPDFLPTPKLLRVTVERALPANQIKPAIGGSLFIELSDLEVPAIRFALRGLSFGVERTPGDAHSTIAILGRIELGSLELLVSGTKSGSDWVLDVQSTDGLSLKRLAEPGLDAISVPQGVIDLLPELALERVRVTLGQSSRKLEIVGKGGSPTLTIDSQKGTTTIALSGQITAQLGFTLSYSTGTKTGTCSITYSNINLLELMRWALRLARPSLNLELPPPWDALLDRNLGNVTIGYSFGTRMVSVDYTPGSAMHFGAAGFDVRLDRLGLDYTPAKAGKPAKVDFVLEGDFSFIKLFDPSLDGKKVSWDLANDSPPSNPGPLAKIFDLRYLGVGQHVAFRNTGRFGRVADVIGALEAEFKLPADGGNPLATASGLMFREDSSWLIGTSFVLLDFLSLQAIWNDPDLYGLRLSLSGPMAQGFAGLEFEILYQKIAEGLGKYHIEFVLPNQFRSFEFGAVTVTLPALTLDVFTNGNFKVDLGFPHGGNFDRSGAIQLLPFIGKGGFYFGLLEGRTSDRVPLVSNGEFRTVIEIGIGLSIGVGKEIDKGVLSGGATLTLDCIIEGVLAWFAPTANPSNTSLYYRIDGMARLRARVWGRIDFKIVSASFEVEASATFTLTIEAYEPIPISMRAEVKVKASAKVAFVRIRFSFQTSIAFSFTIGSRRPAPWQRLPASSARAARMATPASSAMAFGAGLDTLDPVTEVAKVPLLLTPMFTAEAGTTARSIALLTMHGNAFATLAGRLLRDLVDSKITTTVEALYTLATELAGADPARLEQSALETSFTEQKIELVIDGRDPAATETVDAVVFPMPPQLTLESGTHHSGPDTHMQVAEDYLRKVRQAWTEAGASVPGTAPAEHTDTGSLPSIVFRDWFGIVARGLVDLCIDILAAFKHTVVLSADKTKTQSIAGIHADCPWGSGDQNTWGLAFLQANRDVAGLFRDKAEFKVKSGSQELTLTFAASDTLRDVCEAHEVALADLITAGFLDELDLLAKDATVILPELASLSTLDLIDRVVADARLSDISGLASRSLLSGLRLPKTDIQGQWYGLYDLTGQEFSLAFELEKKAKEGDPDKPIGIASTDITLSLPIAADNPAWLLFAGFESPPAAPADPNAEQTPPPTPHATISLTSTERKIGWDLTQALDAGELDAIAKLVEPLPALGWAPLSFSLERSVSWQHGAQPAKKIYPLPDGLLQRVAATRSPIAGPVFQLVCGYRPQPKSALIWRDPGAFEWAIWIDVRVRRVSTPDGTPGDGYTLLGTDVAGAERLLALIRWLGDVKTGRSATLQLLAQAEDGSFTSAAAGASSFVIETNPETVAQPSPSGPAESLSAALGGDPRPLLRVLWKASTSSQGGFVLRYVDDTGAGLPASLFATSPEARLRVLIQLAGYRAEKGTARDAQPIVLPLHNCVILDTALDPEMDRLAVQARSHVVRQIDPGSGQSSAPETAKDVAAALGFAGKAEDIVRALEQANADVLSPTPRPLVAGDRLAPAPDLLVLVPRLAPGAVGFRLLRDDPTALVTPQGQLDGDERIDAVYSLLTCELQGSKAPDGSPHFGGAAFEGPSKPLSPTVAAGDDQSDPRWRYERAFEPYRHLASVFRRGDPAMVTSANADVLAAFDDPYAGVEHDAKLLADLAWGDLFGNVHRGSQTATQQLALRYIDPMRPLHAWPGCAVSWWVEGVEGARQPALKVHLSFDPQPYTLDADIDVNKATSARTKAADQLRLAYFQNRSSDVAFSVESSLGTASGQPSRSYPLTRDRVVDLARGALLFLGQLDATKPAHDTPVQLQPGGAYETLEQFAKRHGIEVSSLTTANPDLANYVSNPLPAARAVTLPGRIRLDGAPAAPVDDGSAVRPGELGMRKAGDERSLQAVAKAHGVPVHDLALANATLVGFVDPSIVENAIAGLQPFGGTEGSLQCLASLYQRWLGLGSTAAQARLFGDFIDVIASLGALVAADVPYLLPAPRVTLDVALDLATPAPLFVIDVTLVAKRTVLDRIDPSVRHIASMREARSTVAPNHELTLGDYRGVQAHAAHFEQAYAFAKAGSGGVQRYEGIKLLYGKESDADSALWGLRLSTGRGPDYAGDYWYDIPKQTPVFYAVRPLSTRALSGRAELRPYPAANQTIADWIASKNREQVKLDDVDLDAWAREFLRIIDLVLTPEYALGAKRVDANAFEQLVETKRSLARAISAGLSSVLAGQDESSIADARAALEQRLLVRLERAYTIDTLLQVPVTTTAQTPATGQPLRLVGELRNVPIIAGADQTVADVAASLGVDAGYLTKSLRNSPEVFVEQGPTFVPAPASKLVAGVTLPLTRVIYPKPLKGNEAQAADFFNLSLPDLLEMIGTQDTTTQVVGVDWLPAYTLGSAEVALDGKLGHMTSFLDVLREGKDRKVFFNLDYVVGSLRHRIENVAEIPGAERSSELRFVIPLDAAQTAEGADIGQVEVPLPLRDTPEAPVILRHAALTEPPEPPAGGGPLTTEAFTAWILSLDDWTYRLEFTHDMAAQDNVQLHVEFDNDADALGSHTPGADPGGNPTPGRAPGNTLLDWLAQFRHVSGELQAQLAQLPAVASSKAAAGAAEFVALEPPLRLLSRIAKEIADAWAVWTPPAAVPLTTRSNYELYQFGVELENNESQQLTAVNLTGNVNYDPAAFVLAYEVTRADGLPLATLKPSGQARFDYPPGGDPAPLISQISSHRVGFTGLDVLERSSARGGLRVTRNANLVTGAAVAPDFIYESPLVQTAGIVEPFVRHLDPIELPGTSLEQTLGALFQALFTRVPEGKTRDVAIRVSYCYELVGGTSLAPRVPLRNRARFTMTKRTGQNDPFVADVVKALGDWEAQSSPSAPNGSYSFHVLVYDQAGNDNPELPPVRRPVLELADLRAPLVSAPRPG